MNNRIFVLDLIRIIAFFLVVLQHVSAMYIPNVMSTPNWWITNFFDSSSRVCVPLFFVVTGALYLDDHYKISNNLGSFFMKRSIKIIIPLVMWSFIYAKCSTYWTNTEFNIVDILQKIIAGTLPYVYHFWFLYAIIGLYAIIPVLKIYVKNSSNKDINYFLFLWILAAGILPLLKKIGFNIGVNLEFITGFIGYLVIGYKLRMLYITNNKKIQKNEFYKALLVLIIGIIITMLLTYKTSIYNGKLDEFFYLYTSINVICMTIFVLLILVYLSRLFNENTLFAKSIIYISKELSFGIYLIHLLILSVVINILGFNPSKFVTIISIPLLTIIVILLSAAVTYLIRKLPFGKFLCP